MLILLKIKYLYIFFSFYQFLETLFKDSIFCYFQVLRNALWRMTNSHDTINAAGRHRSKVLPVPPAFSDFKGMDNFKRKKKKEVSLGQLDCESNANALYSLTLKPIMKSNEKWIQFDKEVRSLADCLQKYGEYLKVQNEVSKRNQNRETPVRTIGKNATIHHVPNNPFGVPQDSPYKLLDQSIHSVPIGTPVIFDESIHCHAALETNLKRWQFVDKLQLSVPIDVIKFSPGGSIRTTVMIMQVMPNRPDHTMMCDGVRAYDSMRENLQEYHTRTQKRLFKARLSLLAEVKPSTAEFLYSELSMDKSTATNPEMRERIRLIYLGETDLVDDLRTLNKGRETEFDAFFEVLARLVEEATAADERRHGMAHLAHWLSLEDMVEKAKENCPPGTPIPSLALVRLQFAPRNPFTHRALSFSSKIKVQYKIQKRQLRTHHEDAHYAACLLKYVKEYAVEIGHHGAVFFCDDKAKVPIGEPGHVISTGVRGKKSIAPTSTTYAALDHDMQSKGSITPSVTLKCRVPDNASESFVRGKVLVNVNDSIFEASNPFRHAVQLCKVYPFDKPIAIIYTDGGTDHRNTLESVKIAAICIFKELNLDKLHLVRCAPGQSYLNPAERVMSILNLGLQNCALQRDKMDDEAESKVKRLNSMRELRKHPELKEKWKESIASTRTILKERFERLTLKGQNVSCVETGSDEEIDLLQRHARGLFEKLDLKKLQKVHTQKNADYCEWMKKHARERTYQFQLTKCDDARCCAPTRLQNVTFPKFVPDPVLNGEHYLPYCDVKGLDTKEDLPSKNRKAKVWVCKIIC